MSLRILSTSHSKIEYWVNNSSGEVSGLGKVREIDGQLVVTDVILLEQVNSSAETELCDKAIGKAMYELRNTEGHLNFWWHSHVNMSCFWSGTDHSAIKQLGKHGWVIATVFNKKEEYRTAYYQKGDGFIPEIFVDDLETSFGDIVSIEQEKEWQKELDDKCKTKKFNPSNHLPALTDTGWADYDYDNDVLLDWNKDVDEWNYPTTIKSKSLPPVPVEDRIEFINYYNDLYGECYKSEVEFRQFYFDCKYTGGF